MTRAIPNLLVAADMVRSDFTRLVLGYRVTQLLCLAQWVQSRVQSSLLNPKLARPADCRSADWAGLRPHTPISSA
jgi:hypothetical protein